MRDCNQGRFRQQIRFLRRQFLQDGDSPFSNILSEQILAKAVTAIETCWLDRIYSPLVTLWVFVGHGNIDRYGHAAFAGIRAVKPKTSVHQVCPSKLNR